MKLEKPEFHNLHRAQIRIEPEMWKEICRIASQVEGDKYEKSAARVVRRCVEYCFKQGIVTKLANMKEWV
jgi:hypothetical protein